MNRRILSLLIAIFFLGSIASKADTPEEFLATYRTALEQKDTNKLLSLYYTNGCSEVDITNLRDVVRAQCDKAKIKNVSLQPLPSTYQNTQIINGKKYQVSPPPDGLITIIYDTPHGINVSMNNAYSVIGDKHYLAASKSTDLEWKGPPDHELNFLVSGVGCEKLLLKAKWNVSGVEQEAVFANGNQQMVRGQYFENISITSINNETDITLRVIDGEIMGGGKEIYSNSLKGKGTLEYKRQVPN